MIAGIIGMIVAFVIVVLVIFWGKRKLDPTISLPLHNFLTSQGFTVIDRTDPIFDAIAAACRLTLCDSYIEQIYKRAGGDYAVCWLSNVNGPTKHLVAAIPKADNRGTWVMLFIPGMRGVSGKIIRKGVELTLSSKFRKAQAGVLGQSAMEYDLYVEKNDQITPLGDGFFHLLPQCGNVIIRSAGPIVLVERISLNRAEGGDQEAGELLRITELLKSRL